MEGPGRQEDKGKTGAGGGRTGRTVGRKTPMLSARHGYAQKHASGC